MYIVVSAGFDKLLRGSKVGSGEGGSLPVWSGGRCYKKADRTARREF